MRYKVGDKVRVKSLDWYNKHKNEVGAVICGSLCLGSINKHFCGKIFTIKEVRKDYYTVIEDMSYWNDEMIEGLVEEENGAILVSEDDMTPKYGEYLEDNTFPTEWNLPDGYEFRDENGNVINASKIVLEKKKPKYPKTYEECCKVLDIDDRELVFNGVYLASKLYWKQLGRLNILNKLLICRDAYWEIAGEEMGLGKPGEPDYDSGVNKYGIICMNGVVQKSNPTTNWERHLNKVLDFPTEEMRDAFYENFKDLIEECKELL